MSVDRSFLDEVFGGAEGYAHFAVGHGPYIDTTGKYQHGKWEQFFFLWPQHSDDAVHKVSELLDRRALNDIYVCPNILKTDKRSKGTAVAFQLLHSDADNGADAAKLESLGAFAVASGRSGHSHVYLRLDRPVPLAQYQTLQQGMRAYFNGDNKISDNDLLRPVGSFNYKAVVLDGLDQPYPVEWIVKPTGFRIGPEDAAAVLGVTLPGPDDPEPQRKAKKASPAAPGNAGNGLHDVEAFDLARYPQVKAAVEKNTGDRSKDALRIVGAC